MKTTSIRRTLPASLHLLAIATGVFALAVSASFADEQPLANSSFDQSTNNRADGWKKIGKWQVKTEDQASYASETKDETQHGARYLEQIIPVPDGWKNAGLMARVRVSDFAGQQKGGYWTVQLSFLDAGGERVGEPSMVKKNTATDDWESLQTPVVAIPEQTASIRVVGGIWIGEGTMDIDSIALVNGE